MISNDHWVKKESRGYRCIRLLLSKLLRWKCMCHPGQRKNPVPTILYKWREFRPSVCGVIQDECFVKEEVLYRLEQLSTVSIFPVMILLRKHHKTRTPSVSNSADCKFGRRKRRSWQQGSWLPWGTGTYRGFRRKYVSTTVEEQHN